MINISRYIFIKIDQKYIRKEYYISRIFKLLAINEPFNHVQQLQERRPLRSRDVGRMDHVPNQEPVAAIVVPRGLKNESCHEWILGGIIPSHFRFHWIVEFIEPPTWTAFLLRVISGRVNRTISTIFKSNSHPYEPT